MRGVSFQPIISPDPKPTKPALSGAGVRIVSTCPEVALCPRLRPGTDTRVAGSSGKQGCGKPSGL